MRSNPISNLPSGSADQTGESTRDRLFAEQAPASDFRFDGRTAAVFDDMVGRSVPLYGEIQRMTTELAADFAVSGTNLFDLGCATGTTLLALDQAIDPGVRFVGVDNSAPMLEQARDKLALHAPDRAVALQCTDLHQAHVVEGASVVVMILTLQFIRPLQRERVLRDIYDGLNDQGCLLLVEKQTLTSSLLNRLYIEHYYALKRRNGYSEVEISQKREALENVLIPYRPEENRGLLEAIGFSCVEEYFRWYNFAGIVALKNA